MTKMSKQKFKYLENEQQVKFFFIHALRKILCKWISLYLSIFHYKSLIWAIILIAGRIVQVYYALEVRLRVYLLTKFQVSRKT